MIRWVERVIHPAETYVHDGAGVKFTVSERKERVLQYTNMPDMNPDGTYGWIDVPTVEEGK